MMDAFRYTCGASTTFTFWPFFCSERVRRLHVLLLPGMADPGSGTFLAGALGKDRHLGDIACHFNYDAFFFDHVSPENRRESGAECIVSCASLSALCSLPSAVSQLFFFALKSLYSILSTSACQLASITFSDTPTVPHLFFPSPDSISTRTRAAVPSAAVKTRTL